MRNEKVTSGIAAWRRTDLSRVVLIFGVLFYVLRVMGSVWRSDLPLEFPDSFSFLSVAELGPFRPEFWFTERPVGTPLVLWLCGTNLRVFFLLQTVTFALGVAVLARTLLDLCRGRFVAWATIAIITSVAAQPRFGLWHLEVMSESLGMSLGILAFALWLRVILGSELQRLAPRQVGVATAVTIAWLLTRDAHLVVAPILIIIVIIAFRRLGHSRPSRTMLRRSLGRSALALGLTVLYVVTSQAVSDRNQYPLINNVGLRVLPDAALTNSWTSMGMPLDDALRQRTGRDAWDDDSAVLTSPDLAEFRSWVRSDGQIVQLRSLIADASSWIAVTNEVLPDALAYDFSGYDRFDTSERLPERLFWFDGIRSGSDFTITMVLAACAIIGLYWFGRRRFLALALLAGLIASGSDLHLSATADAVEVQRHLIGPILRTSAIAIVAIGLGIDTVWTGIVARRRFADRTSDVASRRPVPWSTALATSASVIGMFVAWVGVESRSQDFDPQYARTIVERAARYGGTYYQNGIHNKGPLETAVYDSARIFTSSAGYWFGISTYVLLVATFLGFTAWLVARAVDASRSLAVTAASLVAIHFTVSTSDYAGVLYSRNMTTVLLAAAFAATFVPKFWDTPRRGSAVFILTGIAIGAACQTLLTTALAGTVIAIYIVVERAKSTALHHPWRTMGATISLTVLTAPTWYALRGSFDEFWSGWWTYARFMSSGTGRGLVDQFGEGFGQFVDHYQQRPEAFIALVVFALITWGEWSTFSVARRRLHGVLLAWFAAAWIELVLAQRYSSHYFSVITVPTVFMATIAALTIVQALAERWGRRAMPNARVSYRTVLVTSCALLAVQGTDVFWVGVEGAAKFDNVANYTTRRLELQDGGTRTARAVMDLVSTRGDALWAWTMYPWTYLDHERIPATRFIWKSFMIGEIYLGRTSSDYVLPRTWDWFEEDMNESQPEVFIRPIETLIPTAAIAGTPLEDRLESFQTVYSGSDVEIRFPAQRWKTLTGSFEPVDLLGPQSPLQIAEADSNGWSFEISQDTTADLTATSTSPALRLLTSTASGPCWRLDAMIQRPTTNDEAGIRFRFTGATTADIGLDFQRAWTGTASRTFAERPLALAEALNIEFTLLIGPQSAALVLGDRIVAAVSVSNIETLLVEAASPTLTVRQLQLGPAQALRGC